MKMKKIEHVKYKTHDSLKSSFLLSGIHDLDLILIERQTLTTEGCRKGIGLTLLTSATSETARSRPDELDGIGAHAGPPLSTARYRTDLDVDTAFLHFHFALSDVLRCHWPVLIVRMTGRRRGHVVDGVWVARRPDCVGDQLE